MTNKKLSADEFIKISNEHARKLTEIINNDERLEAGNARHVTFCEVTVNLVATVIFNLNQEQTRLKDPRQACNVVELKRNFIQEVMQNIEKGITEEDINYSKKKDY